ncbi:hypothetical protein N7494_009962 [Penicillium frequentans]|uniref:Uncharacterized protein n=1 Tax=Penicillium frequentans TaxID=3151616 RepID=A0AAD6CQZ6_9EURO|nr:hypothetical protein CBS147337_10296 [Penicillium roqueforti]KAJ5533410.1 hypothetical protein N7494_009962 [Penicillium glabrum]
MLSPWPIALARQRNILALSSLHSNTGARKATDYAPSSQKFAPNAACCGTTFTIAHRGCSSNPLDQVPSLRVAHRSLYK